MRIMIENFGGMLPIRDSRLLPDNMSQFCANADLESGAITPIAYPALIHTFGNVTRRAARIPDLDDPGTPVWMGFTSPNARIFPSPLVNDIYRRHIWLDNNAPQQPQRLMQNSFARIKAGNAGANAPYPLGVPAVVDAPTVVVTGGTGPVITRSYTYTMVNVFGEEGQPGPPTTQSGNSDGTWTVSGLTVPSGVDAAARGIVSFRIYRTVSTDGGAAFFAVATVPIATTSYADTRTDVDVVSDGILLPSMMWREPETMEGFIEMPGGFFAGWKGRSVFFSEPYRPWAWPAEYILSTSYEIISAGVSGSALILFTNSRPVIMSGNRPENMQIIEADAAEPCFFPNAAVSAPEGVYFVGRTGLFLATQASLTNLTRDVIRQTQWQEEYQFANLAAARLNDTQILVLSSEGFGFVLDLSNARTGLIRIENLAIIDSVYNDPYTGEVHAVSMNKVYHCAAPNAPRAIALWDSKEYHLPKAVNMGAMRFSMSDNPLEEAFEEDDSDSIILPPTPPVEGGPWLDQVAVYNYCIYNDVRYNQGVATGTTPPGYPGLPGFPDWPGLIPGGEDTPDLPLDLPLGEVGRVEVYADGKLVYDAFINKTLLVGNKAQRLPSGFKSDRWRFRFVLRVPLRRFVIAETGKELAEV